MFVFRCNPFAPALEEQIITQDKLLGNRKTVNGLFEWFKNTYELRDTTLYGQVFAEDFVFTYFDFDKNLEINWNRDVEMNTTYNLFVNAESISLEWNNYIFLDTTLYTGGAERAFNLNIMMRDKNAFRGTGTARFIFNKDSVDGYWRIYSWTDKSDF